MKYWLATILLVSSCHSVLADEMVIRAAEIVGFGIFDTTQSVKRHGFSAGAIAKDDVSGIRFLDYTTKIPMILGTDFGFQYIINSAPKGKPIRVTSVIKFPKGGMKHPRGHLYTESRDSHEVIIGKKALHGYGFDEDWEMIPGTWVFELWYQKARLIRKTFTVYEVDEQPIKKESVSH